MRGVRDGSALPALVDLALKSPTGFGYALAFGELAVGLGTSSASSPGWRRSEAH